MRPIKFRAYLKAENKIYNVLSFFSKFRDEEGNRVFLDKPLIDWDVTNYQVDWEKVVLMQFTWLLDKNKQPIYEWDILKDWFQNVLVKWNELEEDWEYGVYSTWYAFHFDPEQTEVIWNQFENPELLK